MKKVIRLIIFFFVSLFALSAVASIIFVARNRPQLEELIRTRVACTEHVSAASSAKAPQILFVGNSLTFYYMTPNTVSKFAESLCKARPEVYQLVIPGVSLEDHYKIGRYQSLLREQKFDYVVLQEQSFRSLNDTKPTIEYGQKMAALARQAGAKVFLFETWADRNRLDDQSKIAANASLVAGKIDAQLIRIGDAFFYCRSRFPEIDLYAPDSHHPSPCGSYLASCLLFQSLYRRPSIGAPAKADFDFGFLKLPVVAVAPDIAAKLQKAADSVAQSQPPESEPAR
ncbi:MAG: hypothetical protein QG574_198 [Cyanobacteriota bacterium erpe_2018_sw_21hr_WHONDRS-SW48-000092_B_bin.40]|jgi:hypothetical protein|nr:hypothetical protein [Cyanobacteriota bacterium erpe_2018_sw_21hr_WHONDRS-SW48-000092_B_bin.40]